MCEKCQNNAEALKYIESGYGSEVWSGKLDGVMRWFNVGRAKQLLACVPREWVMASLKEFDVEQMWQGQIHASHIVWEHLPHVNMDDPLLVGVTRDKAGEYKAHVMDGIHRCARAHQEGHKTLRGIQLSPAATADIEIPAEEAVLNDLVNEILATGGETRMINGALCIIGGKPAPSTPDDHPLRAELLKKIMAGPTRFDLV